MTWETHGRPLHLLLAIETELAGIRASGEPTDGWDVWVPSWWQAIFQPERAWSAAFSGDALSPQALSGLRTLASYLKVTGGTRSLEEAPRKSLLESLGDASELLSGAAGALLTEAERLYIFRLLQSAREVVEEKALGGDVDLRAVIDRLNGALLGVAAHLEAAGDTESAKSMMDVLRRIVSVSRTGVYDLAAFAAITDSVINVSGALGS